MPILIFLILALTSIIVFAGEKPTMTAGEEARALIGVEYAPLLLDERIADHLSCTNEGGGSLDDENWSDGIANCQGRKVIVLKRFVKKDQHATWRIVDILLLPPVEDEWRPNLGNELHLIEAWAGHCDVNGRSKIPPYVALVRWGKRNKRDEINWRTGVEKAWTFDTKRGRIVPLSTKGFICEWPAEP